MKLPEYIKPLPAFFTRLPYIRIYKGFLFMRTIYFQKEIYTNLQKPKPDHQNIGYLIHEQTHYKRANGKGLVKFGIPYIFSKRARFKEELIAYKAGRYPLN